MKWAASDVHASSTSYQDAFGNLAESNQGKAHSNSLQMDKVRVRAASRRSSAGWCHC